MTNISSGMPFLTFHPAMPRTSLTSWLTCCFWPGGCPWKPEPQRCGMWGDGACPALGPMLQWVFFYRKAVSAESYSTLHHLPQFFSENHSFPLVFSSFSATPAEQKALEHCSIPLYLDTNYSIRSTTFTNNILELEECEQSFCFRKLCYLRRG